MTDSETGQNFGRIQQVKRHFFAMRNGVIADTLRRAGDPHRIIFGLNLPQLRDLARELGYDAALAQALWTNTSTRESRLLAPMITDPATLTAERALEMINSVECCEVADVLCHSLLRHTPFAIDLSEAIVADDLADDLRRYTALRIAANMMYQQPQRAARIARRELARQCPLTTSLAAMILNEIEFISS